MPETDREDYEYFSRDPETPREVVALAYASFAFNTYGWVKKFQDKAGVAPTYEQVDRWLSEQPDSRLEEIKRSAITVFKAAVDYRERARIEAYEAGKQDAIVRQVERSTAFWRNLPGNSAVSVVSSFAFALLLVVASLVFNKDPSPIALYQKRVTSPSPPQK